jgi:hypothetical protein
MQANNTSADDNPQNTLPEPQPNRLRRFLTWVLLVGVFFNIISWGGAAGFLALKQSGVSIDWGGAGRLPNIRLDGQSIQQTVPSDATLPPTPIDITSVGQPSDGQLSPTPTATRPAERTPDAEVNTPPAAPTP